MDSSSPLRARVAMCAVAGVVLLVQIAATRLLSATVTYHAAFAVLALVMLALAGSATAVYRDRSRRAGRGGGTDLDPAAAAATRAAPVIAGSGLAYVVVGAVEWSTASYLLVHFAVAAALFYACFHLCGYVVAWLLASWPKDVGRVYFADLVGAAGGCLLAVPALSWLSPVQLLCACGALAALAGVLLADTSLPRRRAAMVGAALAALAVAAVVEPSWTRLRSAKSQDQSSVVFEQWNQLARVTVTSEVPGTGQAVAMLSEKEGEEAAREQVLRWTVGWGMSDRWKGQAPESMWIALDTDAGTQILEDGGRRPLEELEALRWDVTAAAYWLRPGGLRRTFVIGGGGGRDFLTALTFGAEAVDVVELNPLVVQVVEQEFADYSGRPYSRPGVSYRLGDARSELSRSERRYDLIQMSMIDTWASSMSGALTLSENALYTREAFRAYLDHLDDDGIFTVSRWYNPGSYAETSRVLSLMGDALRAAGVTEPEKHVAVVTNSKSIRASLVATCLMKRSPLTGEDREALAALEADLGFQVLWPVAAGGDDGGLDVHRVVRGDEEALTRGGFDMTPPGDDRPFFFYTSSGGNGARVPMLFGFLLAVIALGGGILVFAPLRDVEASMPEGERVTWAEAARPAVYFAAIGAGFMGVELGVLQRYIVFLGHPTYALSVVLFSLLLSTAAGSLLAGSRPRVSRTAFPVLLVLLAGTTAVVPGLLEGWHALALAPRVIVAALLIVPLGVCMGTAFPCGVAALDGTGRSRLVPWMWAINGLTGTLASVLGMVVAIEAGYSVLLVASAACYAVAWWSSAGLAAWNTAGTRAAPLPPA